MKFNAGEPKVLQFPDEKQEIQKESKKMNRPNTSSIPGALSFGDDPIPTIEPPKPVQKTGPKTISFDNEVTPTYQPSKSANKPSIPSSSRGVESVAGVGKPLFETQIDPGVKKAIEALKNQYPDLYSKEKPTLDNKLSQLIPLKLEVVTSWGSSAVEDQADLSSNVALLMRDWSQLNVNETMQNIVDEARGTNHQNSFSKFFKSEPDLRSKRLTIIALQKQVEALIPKADDFFNQEATLQHKIMLFMTTLSAAYGAVGTTDNVLDNAIQNRRNLLITSSKQAEILVPQLKEMRKQMSNSSARIGEILTVTLPALELAQAAKK